MMRKWTIIDTLIIVVLIVVATIGVKIFSGSASGGEKTKVEIVLLADYKEIGFADAVKKGEKITIGLSEKDSGIVKKVDSKPSEILSFDNVNGVYYNKPVEDKEDVYIYIEADCTVNERSIAIGETIAKVGAYTSVRGKGYATEGHIVSVNVGGENNE